MTDSPRARILLFLLLDLRIGSPVYRFFLSGARGASSVRLFAFAAMWPPGVSALLTRGILQRSLRDEGKGPGPPRFLLYAYLLPLVLEVPVYLLAWTTGLAGFDPAAVSRVTQRYLGFGAGTPQVDAQLMATAGWS